MRHPWDSLALPLGHTEQHRTVRVQYFCERVYLGLYTQILGHGSTSSFLLVGRVRTRGSYPGLLRRLGGMQPVRLLRVADWIWHDFRTAARISSGICIVGLSTRVLRTMPRILPEGMRMVECEVHGQCHLPSGGKCSSLSACIHVRLPDTVFPPYHNNLGRTLKISNPEPATLGRRSRRLLAPRPCRTTALDHLPCQTCQYDMMRVGIANLASMDSKEGGNHCLSH